ncbi:uncharacterized mitochondrial protein AtMg00810-like [Solanum tuberosum]|uniref:uncharacterized mitochondrial protein AtMg00810-like n=1 Tax=Solanum tuberosum TaxID=4113 RepID=UPI00073A14C2|nr:PREDICTED: uncharacterized mitochondrial protein AtMg00810-like [Solanum tuberosum]
MPQGFASQGENKVCRLVKSLYGLKQAPRQCNTKLSEALVRFGFVQSYDPSLYVKKTTEGVTLVLVYVDDMLITGDSLKLIEETKVTLQQAFKMKNLGELRFFLGIEFARSNKGILMYQRKYTLELLSELGLEATKSAGTPIDYNLKLTSKQFGDHVKTMKPGDNPPTDQRAYQRLIGKLLYLTMTRPDITFSVQTLSQFLQDPKKSHMEAALRVVRYVKNQPVLGILLSSSLEEKISAYCDADLAACPQTRRSVTGYFVKLGDSLVSWK